MDQIVRFFAGKNRDDENTDSLTESSDDEIEGTLVIRRPEMNGPLVVNINAFTRNMAMSLYREEMAMAMRYLAQKRQEARNKHQNHSADPWSKDENQIHSMSIDRLFDVRNPYFLGNYQQCINEAGKFSAKNDEEKEAKDVFLYLSYIAQGKPSIPLSEIAENSDKVSYRAIRRFAEFQNSAKRSKIVTQLEAELNDGKFVADEANCITAAAMLNQSGNPEDALRALYKCDTLHTKAAAVQTLLKMNRVDLAIQQLKKMTEIDEDATLTQLAMAWVNMSVGKDKLKDAFYIYQEMMDKYGQTVLLLVGQAGALILQQKYADAEKLLQEAQQRDSNNAEALINLIIVSEHLGKGEEVTNRYIAQMKDSHPHHPWTVDLLAKEEVFNRVCESSA